VTPGRWSAAGSEPAGDHQGRLGHLFESRVSHELEQEGRLDHTAEFLGLPGISAWEGGLGFLDSAPSAVIRLVESYRI
jgi:hypothetical protein